MTFWRNEFRRVADGLGYVVDQADVDNMGEVEAHQAVGHLLAGEIPSQAIRLAQAGVTAEAVAGLKERTGMKDIPGFEPNKRDLAEDLKALIGMAEDRREAGRRKKAAGRITGRKTKRRARERIAAASRKRNRR